jgi:hypothetical protein
MCLIARMNGQKCLNPEEFLLYDQLNDGHEVEPVTWRQGAMSGVWSGLRTSSTSSTSRGTVINENGAIVEWRQKGGGGVTLQCHFAHHEPHMTLHETELETWQKPACVAMNYLNWTTGLLLPVLHFNSYKSLKLVFASHNFALRRCRLLKDMCYSWYASSTVVRFVWDMEECNKN